MFETAQVGDTPWSSLHGDGRIYRIIPQNLLPIQVTFRHKLDDIVREYSLSGIPLGATLPELFWKKFDIPIEAVTPPARPRYQWLYKDNKGSFRLTAANYSSKEKAKKNLSHISAQIIRFIPETEEK